MTSLPLIVALFFNGALIGVILAVAALGLSLIFGVMNVIHLAHGDMLMLGMFATYWISTFLALDPMITPIITFPLFFVIGLIIYKSLISPIVKRSQVVQITVTLGLLMLIRGGAQLAWGPNPRQVPSTLVSGALEVGGFSIAFSRIVMAVIGIGAILALHLFLTKTDTGLAFRAVADDRDSSAGLGISAEHIYILSFGLGTSLAALAGALLMTFSSVTPVTGIIYTVIVWIIITLAGTGSMTWIIFTGIIVGVTESLTTGLWIHRAAPLLVYFGYLFLLWSKPRGLRGR